MQCCKQVLLPLCNAVKDCCSSLAGAIVPLASRTTVISRCTLFAPEHGDAVHCSVSLLSMGMQALFIRGNARIAIAGASKSLVDAAAGVADLEAALLKSTLKLPLMLMPLLSLELLELLPLEPMPLLSLELLELLPLMLMPLLSLELLELLPLELLERLMLMPLLLMLVAATATDADAGATDADATATDAAAVAAAADDDDATAAATARTTVAAVTACVLLLSLRVSSR